MRSTGVNVPWAAFAFLVCAVALAECKSYAEYVNLDHVIGDLQWIITVFLGNPQ